MQAKSSSEKEDEKEKKETVQSKDNEVFIKLSAKMHPFARKKILPW